MGALYCKPKLSQNFIGPAQNLSLISFALQRKNISTEKNLLPGNIFPADILLIFLPDPAGFLTVFTVFQAFCKKFRQQLYFFTLNLLQIKTPS